MCLTRKLRLAHIGAMTLPEWIAETGISVAEAARRFGVAHSTVARWCSGELFPARSSLTEIRRITDGKVSADDFMPPARAA